MKPEHKSWCPAYPGNVYVKTTKDVSITESFSANVEIVKGSKRPCQCGADLSLRARKILYGGSGGTMIVLARDRVLDFIEGFQDEYGYAPSMRQIAQGLGLKAHSTVAKHIAALEDEGKLRRTPGTSRSYTVTS